MGKTGKLLAGAAVVVIVGGTWLGVSTSSTTAGTTPTTPVATPTTTLPPPANAPVGFNATRTAFVLPYKLGYLPAPELALAKSDPAYAAGLVNLKDWIDLPAAPNTLPSENGWFYLGVTITSALPSLKGDASGLWNSLLYTLSPPPGVAFATASNVAINTSQLGVVPPSEGGRRLLYALQYHGYTIITPTALEVRAAPTGKLTVGGVVLGAFCVPSPEAIIQNGQIVTPAGLTPITAGPSTVFAFKALSSNAPTLYDQGVSSCASFS
ncbi:MAG: hypothetical protein ACYDHP_12815 [Ferrimicrobium sp.]